MIKKEMYGIGEYDLESLPDRAELMVYSTYSGVYDYKSPGQTFGIDFYYERL